MSAVVLAVLGLVLLVGRPRVRIHHIHQSGFAHATAHQWLAMLDHHGPLADVITLTETAGDTARQALTEWVKRNEGWHLFHPAGVGPGQCAILSRSPIVYARAQQLTRLRLKSARKALIHAVIANTFGIRWDVSHLPAHNGGLRRGWPTKVYLSALLTLGRLTHDWRVVVADWNADPRRRRIRKLITIPGLRWAVGKRQHGTHGNRVIDGVQTNLRVIGHSRTLPKIDGFDHAAVLTVLERRKAGR